MSFILDALRKSDQKRRTQNGPDLSTVSDSQPRYRRGGHRRPQWLVIAMLAVLLVFAGLLWMRPELFATILPREAPPPRPDFQTLIIPALPGEPAAVARLAAEEPPPAAVAATAEPEPTTESVAMVETPAAVAPPVPPTTIPEPAPVASAVQLAAPAPPPEPEASPPDYLLFWELPLNIRQGLPPLSLSLHVYSSESASRFVLINGERQREGATLERGVTLVEIRPEGAILEFRNHRFLLSR